MTELRIEAYEIPAADLGPENPLPCFRDAVEDVKMEIDPDVPEEDRRYFGWRIGRRVLPHRMQDGYNRIKRPRAFTAAVLENEFLRATILPELGGRVVSLFHKPSNRDLVDRNPVFQPANLGLRNAWFCGGIEWNTCQLGHYYLTCSPVFAARIRGAQGEPALRIYEWDRVKCFPWQVDLILPPGSPFLFARVRIVNPHDFELAMYWWTNMGVAERSDIRTLAPAQTALHNTSQTGIAVTSVPILDGTDTTYPTNSPRAKEFFFRIPDASRHWIASLDASGAGVFEASTALLRGRKMFVFGMSHGGRHWQEYLMVPGHTYYEIQAGLPRTQAESVPMPANTEWTWTQAFGLLEADPVKVHSADWTQAREAAERALDAQLPQSQLDAVHDRFAEVTALPPDEVFAAGSGWGALERRRLAHTGEPDRVPKELILDDSTLGPEQEPWLSLLETGLLPERDPADDPQQGMVQPEWRAILEESIRNRRSDHWLAWLHLGNMRMEARDLDGARQAWQQSIGHARTGWALRSLAVLEARAGDGAQAAELLRQAWEAGPRIAPLAVECTQSLVQMGRYEAVREFVHRLPAGIRENERIRIISARAAIELGRLEELDHFFEGEFATIREGEVTLTDMWFAYQERRLAAAENVPIDHQLRRRVRREFPPPFGVDFRMSADHP